MTAIDIIQPRTREAFEQYYHLRWQILRQPWQQPPGSEQDELESSAIHAMAVTTGGKVVGVARLHRESARLGQIRYMAVHPGHRRNGIGSALLAYLETAARNMACKVIRLNARKDVEAFYRQHGYRCLGPGPVLFGQIEHSRMEKELVPSVDTRPGAAAKTI